MKFVLSFNGSRGDIQPAVALGVRLAERGHEPVLAVPPNLVEFAESAGLKTHSYGLDTKELLESELVGRDLKSGNPLTRLRAVSEITVRGGKLMQDQLLDLAEGAHAIVGGSAGQERALNVATARSLPYVPVHYCPVRTNSSVFFFQQLTTRFPQGFATRASWTVLEHLLWRWGRRNEDALRGELGLDGAIAPAATMIAQRGVPEIQAYDPALFPELAAEWGERRPLTGFLNLSTATRAHMGVDDADADLTAWLDAGTPPLYVGFGSMHIADPKALGHLLVTVARRLGLRLLLATGWSDFQLDSDENVFVVRTVDHDAVLPRCAAAVHHGGAGSTAAGARAGIPTVVCWIGADQPMWGARLRHVGAGVSVKLADLDEAVLHDAVSRALEPTCVAAARRLAEQMITPDDAADRAADVVVEAATERR